MFFINFLKRYKRVFWLIISSILFYFLIDGWLYVSRGGFTILWPYLILACVVAIFAVVMNALKFLFLIKISLGKNLPKTLWVKIFALSSLMNNAIPHGGTAYRAKFLKEYASITYTEFIGLAYLFAFMGLMSLLTLVGLLFFISFGSNYFILISMVVSLIIVLMILVMRYASRLSLASSFLDFYWKKLAIVSTLLKKILSSGALLSLIGLFLMSAIIDFAVFFLICYAFNIHVNTFVVLLLYVTLSLSWLVKITPGNIGVQELLMGVSSKIIGSGFLVGVSISIFSRFIYILVNALIWLYLRLLVRP